MSPQPKGSCVKTKSNRCLLLGVILLWAIVGSTHATAKAPIHCPKAVNERDLCAGLEAELLPKRMLRMSRPALRSAVEDKTFGSRIVRISDASPGEIIKPLYSTIQAWNADESLLMLYRTTGKSAAHQLYDGKTYEWLEDLDIRPADLEEVFWHTTNPDIFYYVEPYKHNLIEYSVRKRRKKVLRNFNDVCPKGQGLRGGNDVYMMSWDSKRIGLRCGGSQKTAAVVFIYDLASNKILGIGKTGIGDGKRGQYNAYFAPQTAPSGRLAFFQGNVVNEQLQVVHRLPLGKTAEHAVLGRLPNGHDAYFAVGFNAAKNKKPCEGGIGALVAYDMQTGDCNVVVGPSKGHGYTVTSTHLSALSYQNPGWVAVSSIGKVSSAAVGDYQQLFNQELYMAYTDPKKPKVCRVAHHRAWGKANKKLRKPYFAEPHVTISPSGTRLLFGSDWHNGDRVDTYVVELPIHAACQK